VAAHAPARTTGPGTADTHEGVPPSLNSGTPAFAFDRNLRIICWNEAAEELLGVPAPEAVGRHCWEVLRGFRTCGSIECHPGCSTARLAHEGFSVPPLTVVVQGRGGDRCTVTVDTVSARIGEQSVVMHLLREAVSDPDGKQPHTRPATSFVQLTPRQREILELLAQGLPAKTIANRLWLSEATVRNHIHAVLARLGAHSQLEAVVIAMSAGLLS